MAQLKLKNLPKIHNKATKIFHLPYEIHAPHLRKIHIPQKVHTFDAFKTINYRYLWISHAIFSSAFWLQQVVVGWTAYQITQSAFLTSVIMGLDVLPVLIGAPFGGLISDKFDKRKLLGLIYIYQSIIIAIFGIVAIMGHIETWHIFVFVFLIGVARSVHDPTKFSLMSTIISKDGLVNAIALNSMAFSLMQLFIPALGGLLIALIGVGPILIIEATVIIFAGIMIQFIKISKSDMQATPSLKKALPEMRAGFSFVASNPIIIGFMGTSCMMIMLVIPFINGLMPVYAADVFKVGPTGLGILLSALGLGSFLSTILLASFRNISKPGVVGFFILILLSISMFAMSLNNIYFLGLIIVMFTSGAMMSYFNIAIATVQRLTPNHLRGRVTGIYMMSWGSVSIGGILLGTLASVYGVQIATFIGAGILAFCIFIGFIVFKKMRVYDTRSYSIKTL